MQSSLGNNPCGWICPDAEPSALIGHSQPSLSLNPHSAPTSGNTCTQEGDPLQSLGACSSLPLRRGLFWQNQRQMEVEFWGGQKEGREDTAPPHPAWFPPAWHKTNPYVGERAGGCSQGVPGRALPVWSKVLS